MIRPAEKLGNLRSSIVRIKDMTLSTDYPYIDFSAIPQNFLNLWVVGSLRSTVAVANGGCYIRFNGDIGLSYDIQYMRGFGATMDAAETFAANAGPIGEIPGATAAANLFGGVSVHIPSYASQAFNKTYEAEAIAKWGVATGNLEYYNAYGSWRSYLPITRVTLYPGSLNLLAGSRATLYGIS